MGTKDAIREVVAAEPGLTAQEIFLSLPDGERPSDPQVVLRVLQGMAGQVHSRNGRWHPGPDPQIIPPEGPPDESRPGEQPSADIGGLETEIRHQLRGRRLIAEVGLDSLLFERLTDAIEDALPRLGLEPLARTYPYVFMTFLVGQGVYGYEAGNFWGNLPVRGVDNAAGPIFAKRCTDYGLEDFSDLLASEHATRYVAPILAHGGIPKYSLGDFFDVLLRGLRMVGGSTEDLLSYWRTRKSAFANVDKPVARFLLYGGDVSIDFLARCVEAVEFVQRHKRVPSPEESGLPPYVLVWLAASRDAVAAQPRVDRGSSSAFRPKLLLDPWSPLGPEVLLPPVPRSDGFASWRFSSAGSLIRRPASTFEPQAFPLSPQKAWTFEYVEHEQAAREWTFEGFDTSPALLFDPSTNELVPSSGSIRLESVWVLSPQLTTLEVRRADEASAEPTVVEEAAALTGPWTGYVARHVALDGCLDLRAVDGDATMRVKTRPVGSSAALVGEVVEGASTTDGWPIYRGPVALQLPFDAGLDPEQWTVLCTIGEQETERLQVSESFTCAIPHTDGIAPSIAIVVHGALGSDVRLRFAVVPGLMFNGPSHLLLPSSPRQSVRVSAPGLAIDGGRDQREIDIGEGTASVSFDVGDAGSTVACSYTVPKLLWALVDANQPALTFSSSAPVASMRRIVEGELLAISVRVGQEAIPLELHLTIDDQPVQVSDKVKSGRAEGRWTFDLAPFRDVLRTTDAGTAAFVLRVGQVPVTVLRLRASIDIHALELVSRVVDDFCSVHASFTSATQQRDRVLRMWSVLRPWEDPVVEPIADDRTDVDMSGYQRLFPGYYVAEIAVDDGWTCPVAPASRRQQYAAVRHRRPYGRGPLCRGAVAGGSRRRADRSARHWPSGSASRRRGPCRCGSARAGCSTNTPHRPRSRSATSPRRGSQHLDPSS